jgi:sulfur carrier protein
MSNLKFFIVNGQEYFTEYELTISQLVEYFNFKTSLLVLEYNRLICDKKNWDSILIKDSDTIEIVTIVGGG